MEKALPLELLKNVTEFVEKYYTEHEILYSVAAPSREDTVSSSRTKRGHRGERVLYDMCLSTMPDFEVKEKTFAEMLFSCIDKKGVKDSEIYKKANVDRKLFSKIRSDINYKPSKKTAISLCIALELDIDMALDLLHRAGFTLSCSNKGDLIVRYFIQNKNYDLMLLNQTLEHFDQPILNY